MIDEIIYLDNNATTKLDPEVQKAILPFLNEKYANPSSIYAFAQEIRKEVEIAREKVAKLLNAEPYEIFFTSGGTEADNTAIKGIAFANREKGKHIITSSIEHPAVLNTCKYLERQGFEVTYIPVDKYGIVDLEFLKKSMRKDTILISIMYANNEIGTIEPIAEIGKIAREREIYFHTDAVQAAGKIKIDVKEQNIDLLSISGHKFYGPKGIGVLYIKKGIKIDALLQGGHQENGKRAGTENVAFIIGLGKACEIADIELKNNQIKNKIKKLRDKLENGILKRIPEVIVNGHPEKRMDNTLNICIKYIEGESVLINLDFEGICASSGSACASGSLEPSHVLLALGLPHEIAHGSLRFSLSKYTEEREIDKVLEVLPGIVQKLRNLSPFWKEKENAK